MERETKETRIRCSVKKGTGQARIAFEGIVNGSEPLSHGGAAGGVSRQGADERSSSSASPPSTPHVSGRAVFARHMLETLAKWSGYDVDLHVVAKDGLEHHAIEDAAIALGTAFRQAIDTASIERTAHVVMPMDDALVLVALDLVERPYYEGPLPDPLMDHVLRSLATEGRFTLHVQTLRGRDPHHVVEAAFKGLALCLDRATRPRAERLSTKGAVETR